MKKLKLAFLLAAAFTAGQSFAQSKTIIHAYIEKFKDIAMEEMQRTGVPASITLAQGIHETGAGTSKLVLSSNNHFGIKCKTEWQGEKVYHDDDARGECFRKYEDPITSYKDHSDFLRTRSHYASLFELDPTDYEAWAHGLKKAGYATNPRYPQILIKLIRDYNLQDYTLIALGRKARDVNEPHWVKNNESANSALGIRADIALSKPKKEYPQGTFKINDTKVIYIPKGTSYLKIASDYDIPLSRLFDFNDLKDGDVALEDELLFLQRKRKTGENETHTVAQGETLRDIAQAEGIRLATLLEYNFLTANVQPQAGEKLYLKKAAPTMPKLSNEKPMVVTASFKSPEPVKEEVKESLQATHTVQAKETLYSIARKYNVAVEDVKKWNDMETNELKIGQQLKINKSR